MFFLNFEFFYFGEASFLKRKFARIKVFLSVRFHIESEKKPRIMFSHIRGPINYSIVTEYYIDNIIADFISCIFKKP